MLTILNLSSHYHNLQFVPFIRKHGEIRHRPFLKIRHALNNIPLPDQTTSFFTFTINHTKHDQCVHVTNKSAYFSIIKLCAFQLMARNQVHILLPSIRTTKINSSMKFPHGSRTIMIMCALSALFFFSSLTTQRITKHMTMIIQRPKMHQILFFLFIYNYRFCLLP